MRERGVWHTMHFLSASITELEMFDRWPGMITAGDIAVLVADGYLVELDGKAVLTPKGIRERDKERASRVKKKKPAEVLDAEAPT
jgi:hypothetical protein